MHMKKITYTHLHVSEYSFYLDVDTRVEMKLELCGGPLICGYVFFFLISTFKISCTGKYFTEIQGFVGINILCA